MLVVNEVKQRDEVSATLGVVYHGTSSGPGRASGGQRGGHRAGRQGQPGPPAGQLEPAGLHLSAHLDRPDHLDLQAQESQLVARDRSGCNLRYLAYNMLRTRYNLCKYLFVFLH